MLGLNFIPVPALLLISIAIASVLIYVPFVVVAYSRLTASSGYDRSAPRTMFDQLPPYAQRAQWAHQNAFESFMIFSVAALMAYITGQQTAQATAQATQAAMLPVYGAIAYLCARLFYAVAYIANWPTLRSLMFAIGNIGIITLFTVSIRSVL